MAVAPISIKIESAVVRAYLRRVPHAVRVGMYAAASRAGQRFFAFHARERLKAKEVSSSGALAGTGRPRKLGEQGRVGPLGSGFIYRRQFTIRGDSIDNLTLSMTMPGGAALLHEAGGTQTAKGGGFLAIPMPAAKDARGKVSKKARQLLRESRVALRAGEQGLNAFGMNKKGTKLRQFRSLIKVTHANGKSYLAHWNPGSGKKGPKGRLTYWFHLQKSVRVKPRLQFYSTWRAYRPKAMEIFRQALPHAIAAAGRKLKQPATLPGGP